MMDIVEKRKCVFHELFCHYTKKGYRVYKKWLAACSESSAEKSWKSFLFSLHDQESQMDYLSAFTYYLACKVKSPNAAEFKDTITELEKRYVNKKSDSDGILLLIASVLHNSTPDNPHGAMSDMIIALHAEVVRNSDRIAKIFFSDPTNHTTYEMYLRLVAEYLYLICPDYFATENDSLNDPVFCTIILNRYINRNKENTTPRLGASYMYNGLRCSNLSLFYQATSACYSYAMANQDYQSAYDVLYSWIEKKMVGQYRHISRDFTEEDTDWRKKHIAHQDAFYFVLCALCSGIADMQSTKSVQYSYFRDYSTNLAIKVLQTDQLSIRQSKHILYGLYALINNGEYQKAATAAKACLKELDMYDGGSHQEQRPAVLLSAIISHAGMLCNAQGDKKKQTASSVKECRSLLHTYASAYLTQNFNYNQGKAYSNISNLLAQIRTAAEKLDFPIDEFLCPLICTYQLAHEIRRELRYDKCLQKVYMPRVPEIDCKVNAQEKCCQPVAYYTTMNNLKYLLEQVYTDGSSSPRPLSAFANRTTLQGKNCLTMMHAHYMNDPSEGITLLEALSDDIDQNSDEKNILFQVNPPAVFRERLFDNQFVFLKSFTDIVDQLNMWSMYGSDRSENTDSNGCCVRIAPESFEMMLSVSHLTSIIRDLDESHDTDDLRLYTVAYLEHGELCDDASKPMKNYYTQLKEQMRIMNDILAKNKDKNQRKQLLSFITPILQEILTPIIFLFKDASYRAEHELRLIITRSRTKEDMERISKTPQTPPKLYVNPYHQVYIDQIILGPKVKAPDNWIPHLQFELTKMWESWPEEKYGKRVPSVRKSSINYRD